MIDFRKIIISFGISYLSEKLTLEDFHIIIKRCINKYKIKYVYSLSNGNKIKSEIIINKSYFDNLYKRFIKTDFNDINKNNPDLIQRRDGSSTELWIYNLLKIKYCEIFVLEHFYKEYDSMKYLYDIIYEILITHVTQKA